MNRWLRLADHNLTRLNLRQDVQVDEKPEIDPRRVRTGMMIMGAVTAIALALLIAVNDPVGRFIFGFVAVASLIQTWRARRHWKSLQ